MAFLLQDVQTAQNRIQPYVTQTPLEKSPYLSNSGRRVFFKLECLQKTRSFKLRGALNKMLNLTGKEMRRGIGAVSSGNHGCAVSYAAQLLGIGGVTIIVPKTAPHSKVEKIRHYGGQVLQLGQNYDEAHTLGMQYIAENGLINIDSCHSDPLIYAGQGTIGLEIMAQNPHIDTIVVPIGGGGMITGIAVAAKSIKPSLRVVGVQSQACPAMIMSYKDGVCHEEYSTEPSLCDSLIGGIGTLSYEMGKDLFDELVLVSEESVAKAVAFMCKQEKYVAEPGSCTTIAALWEHPQIIGDGNIALVISGANIDGELMARLLQQY